MASEVTITVDGPTSVKTTSAKCSLSMSDIPDSGTYGWVANGGPSSGSPSPEGMVVWSQTYTFSCEHGSRHEWAINGRNLGIDAQSTDYEFTGLSVGTKNDISITAYVIKDVYNDVQTVTGTYPEGVTPSSLSPPSSIPSSTIHVYQGDYPLTIYTRPENFKWSSSVVTDAFIEISAADWKKLYETATKRRNALDQNGNTNYTTSITSGNWITAEAFGDAMDKCDAKFSKPVKDETLITADIFNNLQKAVNTYYAPVENI